MDNTPDKREEEPDRQNLEELTVAANKLIAACRSRIQSLQSPNEKGEDSADLRTRIQEIIVTLDVLVNLDHSMLKTRGECRQLIERLENELETREKREREQERKKQQHSQPENAETKEVLATHIRWMIRRDMPEVLAIENESFEFPWNEEDFVCCLRQRNCFGMVAEHCDKKLNMDVIAGFMIYERHRKQLHVLNFAVHPQYRRKGVGVQMVNKLVSKLSQQRRQRLTLEVRETNLHAQQFFRKMGFRAVHTARNFYLDADESAYVFQYSLEEEGAWTSSNRIQNRL